LPSDNTLATISSLPLLVTLVVLDLADGAVNRWLAGHALTTSAIVSVLLLLITVLNVDRIARRRQARERAQVTAAQAAIVNLQAGRATDLVRAALDDRDQREPAADELRTYMTMLLISAPILIDTVPTRTFLECAQRLGGLLSIALQRADDDGDHVHDLDGNLKRAADALSDAAQPLLKILDLAQLAAVDSGGDNDATAPAQESR
jgi:hypothetical protein